MASAQTYIEYGEVKLFQCLTKRFEQRPVYDETGTDLLYFKTTVRVVGFITGGFSSTVEMSPNTGTGDAASSHVMVRRRLMMPRQRFLMKVGALIGGAGGSILLDVGPATESPNAKNINFIDLNNGPKCTDFSIARITQNNVFRVEAEFEICHLECNDSGAVPGNTSGVLNNRWSCQDVIDDDFYTTRTYSGVIRLAHAGLSPSDYRIFILPPLQLGMKRESMDFNVSANSLEIRYTVVDKEVAFAAPAPATNWSYKYTETVGDKFLAVSDLQISLTGDRNVNKGTLVQIVASIIESRLLQRPGGAGSTEGLQPIIEHISITDSYSTQPNQNTISGSARVRRNPSNEKMPLVPILHDNLARPIDQSDLENVVQSYDWDQSRGNRPGERKEAEGPISAAGALAAYLQSPCNPFHAISRSDLETPAKDHLDRPKTQLSGRVWSKLPKAPTGPIDQSHFKRNYTNYVCETFYDLSGNRAQLPVARNPNISSAFDDSSAIVALSNKTAKRVTRITAERVGAWPELPSPEDSFVTGDSASNASISALLQHKIMPATRDFTPDGQPIYRISAEYIYAMSRPPLLGETVMVGFNPWETNGVNKMDTAYVYGGQINSGQGDILDAGVQPATAPRNA